MRPQQNPVEPSHFQLFTSDEDKKEATQIHRLVMMSDNTILESNNV
mgnify:CR=1 FL=1